MFLKSFNFRGKRFLINIMNYKIIFGFLSTILAVLSFLPYLKDIFAQKTKPHIYSWLIWSILQTTGVLAMIAGHAGWGALGLGVGSFFCIFIFFISFKYGTKDITTSDTICLVGTICAILVWVFLKDPLFSVILVTIIDFAGFIPTYRKSYVNPQSETISLYALSAVSNLLNFLAIGNYSVTTALYVTSLVITNAVCVFILVARRRIIAKFNDMRKYKFN